MALLNDLIDMDFPEFVEKIQRKQDLHEELVNAESKGQGDLYDVILLNPTIQELNEYDKEQWRVIATKDGKFWYAYMYDWTHDELSGWLVDHKLYGYDYELARLIIMEDVSSTMIAIVINVRDAYGNEKTEEQIQEEYIRTKEIVSKCNYVNETFNKVVYVLDRRDEEAEFNESLNENAEPKLNDNFWKWFGNSKTIKNGQPMVFYHGTPNSFTTFDIEKSSPYGIVGQGFYFTDSRKTAENYIGGILNRETENSHVKSCYLRMINPYNLSDVITDDEIASLAKFIKANNDDFWYKKILDDADRSYDEKEYPKGFMFEEGYLVNPKSFNRQLLQNAINWLYKAGVIKNNNLIRDNVWWIMTDGYHTNSSKRALKKWLSQNGYDSVIYQIIGDNKGNGDWVNNCYVVFNPNQIKSVDNKGLYSLENNDINEQLIETKTNKIIAYHGSQSKRFNFIKDKALYLTTSKEKAKSYAIREWDEGLIEGEIPVVFTFEVNVKNPYRTNGTEDAFFNFCDSMMNEEGIKEDLIEKGYDSVIHNDLICVFYPNQVKLVKTDVLPKSHKYYYPREGGIDPEDVDDYYYDELDEAKTNKKAKVIAYHGSQSDNLQFYQNHAFYLTDDYELAKELALKDGDGGLYDGEVATVYTCELDIKNPYQTYSETEYDNYFVDTQLNRDYWLNRGYDSIIVHPTEVSQTTYYIMLKPEESVKIVNKTILDEYGNEIDNQVNETLKLSGVRLDEKVIRLNKNSSNTKLITSAYELNEYLKNNRESRVVYDKEKNWFLVNSSDYIHIMLINDALLDGIYPSFNWNDEIIDGTAEQDGKVLYDLHKDRFVLFRTSSDPNNLMEYTDDRYTNCYYYKDYYVFDREKDFMKTPLFKLLGKPEYIEHWNGEEFEELTETIEYDKIRDNVFKYVMQSREIENGYVITDNDYDNYITYYLPEELIKKLIDESGYDETPELVEYVKDNYDTGVSLEIVKYIFNDLYERNRRDLEVELSLGNKIYRLITSNDDIDYVIEQCKIHGTGNCWAKTKSRAESYFGGKDKYDYIFEAEFNEEDVDWEQTMYLRMVADYEDEIRLKKTSKINVLSVMIYRYKETEHGYSNIVEAEKRKPLNIVLPVGDKYSY